jgi:hypothetical protein
MTSGKALPSGGESPHIAFRIDAEQLARVDALAVAMSTVYLTATRSDALRALIGEALPVLEARHAKPAKGGKR